MRVIDGAEIGYSPSLRPRSDVGEPGLTVKRRAESPSAPEEGSAAMSGHAEVETADSGPDVAPGRLPTEHAAMQAAGFKLQGPVWRKRNYSRMGARRIWRGR